MVKWTILEFWKKWNIENWTNGTFWNFGTNGKMDKWKILENGNLKNGQMEHFGFLEKMEN